MKPSRATQHWGADLRHSGVQLLMRNAQNLNFKNKINLSLLHVNSVCQTRYVGERVGYKIELRFSVVFSLSRPVGLKHRHTRGVICHSWGKIILRTVIPGLGIKAFRK